MIICGASLHAAQDVAELQIIEESSKPTAYARELTRRNNSYCNTIDRAEKNAPASIPYEDLNRENNDRFVFAASKKGEIVDRASTHDELNAVADSLWQHAACLLESGAIYDRKANAFKEQGLKEQMLALMAKTVDKEGDDDQAEKRKINALHLINGLSYAIGLYTGQSDFDMYTVAGLEDWKKRELNPALKNAMDTHFEKLYENAYASTDAEMESRGHFLFIVASKSIAPHFTLLQRRYVTLSDANSDMERKAYQAESLFYAVRVTSVETVAERFPISEIPLSLIHQEM